MAFRFHFANRCAHYLGRGGQVGNRTREDPDLSFVTALKTGQNRALNALVDRHRKGVLTSSSPPASDDPVSRGCFLFFEEKPLLTLNIQQLHFDAAYAAKTEWKKMLVDSTFTLALLTGMSVRSVSGKVVANLGWDKVKATHPVFAGDTLYAESKVLDKRDSKSRPTQGIVRVATRGINQDGKEVMSFERTMLIYKRNHSPDEAAGY